MQTNLNKQDPLVAMYMAGTAAMCKASERLVVKNMVIALSHGGQERGVKNGLYTANKARNLYAAT